MDENFVTFNQAFTLYKLGFNEPCLKYAWEDDKTSKWFQKSSKRTVFHYQKEYNEVSMNGRVYTISIPLYSQVFLWIIQNHMELCKDYGKFPHITMIQNCMLNNPNMTYPELECMALDNLLMIIKKRKNGQ